MVLGQQALTFVYTLVNEGTRAVDVNAMGLEPDDDPRVVITGGTCRVGLVVKPQKQCSIEIMIHPQRLGLIKQVLYVHCVGEDAPTWIELMGIVTLPTNHQEQGSFLVKETQSMYDDFRTKEQEQQQRWTTFEQRRTRGGAPAVSLEHGQMQQMKTHPYFADSQRFDGVEPNVSPNPANNPKGQETFQQEQENQLEAKAERLGYSFSNTPKFNPKPQPS